MSNIKDKILLTLGVIVFIVACGFTGYFLLFKTSNYYVQIDNSKVQNIGNGEYEYNLRTYDEHGKMKDFTFKSNRELREDAYLRLETNVTRGVITWEEVTFEELPKDVQFRYQAQKDN